MKVNTWHVENGQKEIKFMWDATELVVEHYVASHRSEVEINGAWKQKHVFPFPVDFPISIVPPLVPLPLHTTFFLLLFILSFFLFHMVSRPYSSSAPTFPRVQTALPPPSFLNFLPFL
jgi:hypothetical protein